MGWGCEKNQLDAIGNGGEMEGRNWMAAAGEGRCGGAIGGMAKESKESLT